MTTRSAAPASPRPSPARAIVGGVQYFAVVFAAGFALALVRIPLLVPHLGQRTAELIEMPVMLLVIAWASRRLAFSGRAPSDSWCLVAGLAALLLMLAAELSVAFAMGARSLGEVLANRDPVSGSVYLASLAVFGLAPWLWRHARRRN